MKSSSLSASPESRILHFRNKGLLSPSPCLDFPFSEPGEILRGQARRGDGGRELQKCFGPKLFHAPVA